MSYNVLNNVSFVILRKKHQSEQHLRYHLERSQDTDVTKMSIQ